MASGEAAILQHFKLFGDDAVIYCSIDCIFEMQREDQWQSNRGYIQHLDVLKRITSRKAHHRRFTAPKHPANPTEEHRGLERAGQCALSRAKDATFREQQILWENYHLGKRIIETPPVISKRKLDQDYQKHRRLVQCLTSSSSRKAMPCDFRVKKLQEYKQNMELQLEQRMQSASSRNLIRFQISSLAFYRQRPALDNLTILFTYSTKSGKTHKQNSESFPAQEIIEKQLYFGVSKRLLNSQEVLTAEIKNLKGLSVLSVGHFSFPSSLALQKYKAQLFHCGKAIGEVQLSTAYARRSNYRTTESEAQALTDV